MGISGMPSLLPWRQGELVPSPLKGQKSTPEPVHAALLDIEMPGISADLLFIHMLIGSSQVWVSISPA